MTDDIEKFKELNPSVESYWRSIILYGNNTASYKFALGKCLLEISKSEKNIINLSELAPLFSKYICEHMATSPKQTTSTSSTFLNACQQYNEGKINKEYLFDIT